MFLHLDHIPLPAVVFSPQGEKLDSNGAYEDTFGPEHLSNHQTLADGPEERRESVSVSILPSGDKLLCFSHPLPRRSFDELSSLATELTKVGAWELDVKTGRLRRTKEILEIYGVDSHFDSLISSSILKLYGPEAQAQINEAIERATETGEGFDLELPLTNACGQDLWVRLRGRAEFSRGECVRLFGTVQDITEEHQVRTRLAPAASVPYPVCHSALRETLSSLLRTDEPPSEGDAETPVLFRSRILLVEDNAVNQRVATRMLKKCGAVFELAEDGLQALDLLSQQSFDLVLMDLQMPNLDGIEAARRLREGSAGPLNQDVPVVALTAHATQEHRAQCFEVGMNDFLAKPLRLGDLRQLFGKWLSAGRGGSTDEPVGSKVSAGGNPLSRSNCSG